MIYSGTRPPGFHVTSTEGAGSSTGHEWKSRLGDPSSPDSCQQRGEELLLVIYTEKRVKQPPRWSANCTYWTSTVQSVLKIKLEMEKIN